MAKCGPVVRAAECIPGGSGFSGPTEAPRGESHRPVKAALMQGQQRGNAASEVQFDIAGACVYDGANA